MLHTTLAVLALSLLASLLTATGCGGSSKTTETTATPATTSPTPATSTTTSSTTPTTTATPATVPKVTVKIASGPRLTRAQWIAKGNAACARFNTEMETIGIKSASEIARVLPQEAAYVRAEVVSLTKVVPPSSAAKDWQEYIDISLQWAEATQKLTASGAVGGAVVRLPLAATITELRKQLHAIALRNHLRACAVA
jgi:hypothetical protein